MNLLSELLSQFPEPAPTKKQRRGIEIKSQREIAIMREAGQIVATVLKEISEQVKPGMTTGELDAYAEKRIRDMGGVPSLKGYQGFPATLCTSINNEAVHGIPSPTRVIESGDVLKVDICACYHVFHGYYCVVIAVGEVFPESAKLIRLTEVSLYIGIE